MSIVCQEEYSYNYFVKNLSRTDFSYTLCTKCLWLVFDTAFDLDGDEYWKLSIWKAHDASPLCSHRIGAWRFSPWARGSVRNLEPWMCTKLQGRRNRPLTCWGSMLESFWPVISLRKVAWMAMMITNVFVETWKGMEILYLVGGWSCRVCLALMMNAQWISYPKLHLCDWRSNVNDH